MPKIARRVATIAFALFTAAVAHAAPVPTAALNAPPTALLGSGVSITVSFTTTGSCAGPGDCAGYGPYLDVFLPANGADGAVAPPKDGITYNAGTALFLGVPVVTTVLTFDASGHATHPYAKTNTGAALIINGNPGDQLVVFQLPFGSFTVGQPAATVAFTAHVSNLADVGTPLPIKTEGGFQYGADPLDNPTVDPSIVGPSVSTTVTPTLFLLTKKYLGPEQETATGPNFPRQYVVNATVALGQTLTTFDLSDVLPGTMQFVSVDSVSGNGTTTVTPISTPLTTTPGGTITRRLDKVVGTGNPTDAQMLFTFYVPENSAAGPPVLPLASGAFAPVTDNASAQGNWTPIDPRDSAGPVSATAVDTFTAKSIAIQKSVADVVDGGASGPTPEDTLEYTLTFQISDFFGFQSVSVTDLLSDGQDFDPTFTPTISYNQHGTTISGGFASGNFSAVRDTGLPASTGQTTIQFDVSSQITALGGSSSGQLLGASLPNGGTGGPAPSPIPPFAGTTATITFHAKIRDHYSDKPSVNAPVVQGDHLTNGVTESGAVLNFANLSPAGPTQSDTSSAFVDIARGALSKTIYAVNGNTSFSTPVHISPGDTVTYRLTYTLPESDITNFKMTDYLPLPIFDATTISTTFDTTVDATPPAAGHAKFGPSDTFFGISNITPTVVSDAANGVEFSFGTFKDPLNRPSVSDILLTVTVSDQPFADALFLTNQAQETEDSQTGGSSTASSIIQIVLNEPVLNVRKGVVSTDNPAGVFSPVAVGPVTFKAPGSASPPFTGSVTSPGLTTTPVHSTLSKVDAGDLVRFAIVIENTGGGANGAFNVEVKDTLPAGFLIPAGGLNLQVVDGTGAAFTTTDLGGGLFGTGIQLNDPGPTATPTGALDPGKDSSGTVSATGRNIAVITYDLQLASTVTPLQVLTNTATLLKYTGDPVGPNFIPGGLTVTTSVTIAPPVSTKTLVSTSIVSGNNTNARAVIGEIATYQLVVTIPEGVTPAAQIVDTMPNGLAFVDFTSGVLSSSDLTITGSTTPVVTNNGRTVTFNLGNVTNANVDNSTAETITLIYRAVVLNVAGNVQNTTLHNSAVVSWTGHALGAASASNVTVIEPLLQVAKSVVVNGSGTTGDAGDNAVFTIVVTNPAAATRPDGNNVTLTDVLPPDLTYVVGSVANPAGLAPTSFGFAGNTLTATWAVFGQGQSSTLTFSATLAPTVTPNEVIPNTATATWTSLPGADPGQISAFNVSSHRRDGSGGINNYTASGSTSVTVFGPAPVKSIVATSESSSTTPAVVIGEIARFRLVSRVSEGTAPNFQLRDNLPAGLQFVNDNTAKIAFVANGGGIASSTLDPVALGCTSASPTPLSVNGNETNVAAITPTCVLPDLAVSKSAAINDDSYASGDAVFFKAGDLTNSDNDPDQEFVVVEFNALVNNLASNVAGVSRSNTFTVRVSNIDLSPSSNTINVTIAEPTMSLTKNVLVTPNDAGDPIAYTITATNTSSGATAADAFDVLVTDNVTANIVSVTGAATSVPGYATATNLSVGNNVSFSIDRVKPGDSVTITVSGVVAAATPASQILANSAFVTWTSLPGNGTSPNPTGSITPGGSGAPNGERNGSDGVGGPLNKYAANAIASTITLAGPAFVKLTSAPTTHAIGEPVTFNLVATLSEGVTKGLVVGDALPAGLGFVSASVITTASGSSGLLAADFNGALPAPTITAPPVGSSGAVTLVFGDSTAAADNVTNNNAFLVQIVARVLNQATNVNGTVFTNTASLQYTNPNTATTVTLNPPPVTVSVVEPRLQLAKSAVSLTPTFGDTITYTITVTNAAPSTTVAYDAALTDLVPAGLTYVAGSLMSTAGVAPTSLTDATAPTLSVSWASFPLGATSTLTYQARVDAPPGNTTGSVRTNAVNLTWTSLAGPDPNERTGSGSPPFNNYQAATSRSITVAGPDLSITKTHTDAFVVGAIRAYDITVTNGGTGPTTGTITVTDTLPPGLTFVSGSGSGWSCVGGAPGAICTNPGPLGASASTTLTLRVFVGPSTPSSFINSATVSTPGDGTSGTKTANDPTSVSPAADVAVTKISTPPAVVAGANLTYALHASNNGPSDASAVVLSDSTPASTTFVSIVVPGGWSCVTPGVGAGGTVACSIPTLPSGASADFTLVVQVDASAAAGTVIGNTASVSTSTFDTNPANNSASAASTVVAAGSADLAVTKSASPLTAAAGSDVTYTIGVTNNGPSSASAVVLSDATPPLTTFQSVTAPGGWSCMTPAVGAAGTVSCSISTLAAGASASFSLAVQIAAATPAGTVVSNTASVSSSTPDSNPANNSATASSTVAAAGTADLAVTKSAMPLSAAAGDNIAYAIGVTNNGPSDAVAAVFSDTLPASTTFQSLTAPGAWSCVTPAVGAAGSVTCSIPTLVVGASASFTLTVQIDLAAPNGTVITNTASVSSSTTDPIASNNSASASSTVAAGSTADLAVTKTASPEPVLAGQNLTYTLTVTDLGPATATGVTLTDPLPATVSFVSSAPSQGSCSGGATVSCDLGSIAAGNVATVVITVVPGAAAAPSITNTASVTSTTTDPNPTNDSAAANSTVTPAADLAIAKTLLAPITPGGPVSYRIDVTNNGPSAAALVVWNDTTPPLNTFQSIAAPGGWSCVTPAVGAAGTISCSAASLASGALASFTIVLQASSALPNGTLVSNTATVTSSTSDPFPANNTSTVAIAAGAPVADVVIVKTGPANVVAGTNVVFTIVVTNNGPSDASAVSVTDPTPGGLVFVSNAGACTAAFPCSLGTIPAGQSRTITSTYSVPSGYVAPNPIDNTATVSSPDDASPGNNSSTAATALAPSVADLSIIKTASPAAAITGQSVTYTLAVSNAGPSDATGVLVTDPLPPDVTFVSATPSQGSCSGTTTVTCSLGTVPNGGSATVTIVVRTTTAGPVVNTATVTANETDPDGTNNVSTQTLQVSVPNIPTLSETGLAALALLLALVGFFGVRRRI